MKDKTKRTNMPPTEYSRAGGLNTVVLVVLLVFSFSALVFGIVMMYADMKVKDAEEVAVKVNEVSYQEDPKLKERITALERSLQEASRRNAELTSRMSNSADASTDLKQKLEDANTQVGFLNAERARLEGLMKDRSASYENKISKLASQKDRLASSLKEERAKTRETEDMMRQRIVVMQGEIERATAEKEELRKTIGELSESRLVDETAKMHYNLATHFLESNRYQLALEEYQRALRLRPYDADAHYNIALLYDIYKTDPVRAIAHYRKCLEFNPKFKGNDRIQERITELTMQEAVSISPTLARDRVNSHDYRIDNIQSTMPDVARKDE